MIYDLRFKNKSGFTLLELLVVIAIIAILIALGTVSYSTAQKKSRDSKVRSDLKEIQNALETYHSINGSYPTDISDLDDPTNKTYFSSGYRPKDPKTNTNYSNYSSSDGSTYCLCSNALEITGKGNASGVACTFAAGDYFCVSSLQ